VTARNLEHLLRPRSLAVIGASDRPHSVGATVMRNVRDGGFEGEVWPVNLRHRRIAGQRAYRTVAELPEAPELAVVCTPAATIPQLIGELGARGTRAAVVLTAGVDDRPMLEAARPYTLRILGPNCVGLLVPGIKLNASFAHTHALPGPLAFVSQSGALTTALLDWARARNVGFSHFISLGNSADVDFGDLLDYLASDPSARAILLYVESISAARKFMSAARGASRNKPVIVVKSGRVAEGAKAAASHTGALAGADDVYDAAFRRAGMLRVDTTGQLFAAAGTLARIRGVAGNRLLIVSNGGGPGVMATDALVARGGELAALDEATLNTLDAALPRMWSRGNPVDLIGDAPVERYVATLRTLLADPPADALLLIHAPTAIVPSSEIARACAPLLANAPIPALACWMGADAVREAERVFADAGLATYSTPEAAVGAFMQLARYRRNQELLIQAPPSIPESFAPAAPVARAVVARALAEGRGVLTEPEAKQVLAAYGIPVVETRIARTARELGPIAAELGFPLALKILSRDISHKSDVGGVVLDLGSVTELRTAARAMLARCKKRRPQARLEGFTVQKMVRRSGAYELICGLATDPVFGPVVLFRQGGVAVETIADKAVALPPLNLTLARELIEGTRISKLLAGFRDHPPVDRAALELVLLKISQLAADLPEVVELDVNPLLADEHGVIALDARIRVEPPRSAGTDRFAIRPYPSELEERVDFHGKHLLLRPIRPEDRPQHEEFLRHIDPEDMRLRFFRAIRELPASELARFTQIDYDREMAFIAVDEESSQGPQTLGVARAHADPDLVRAEFAILVRSDLQGLGLGSLLLRKLIDYWRGRGLRELTGDVLAENTAMLALAQDLGFRPESPQGGCVRVNLALT
jgi:acetyltransferase